MTFHVVGSFPLGGIHTAANASAVILGPVLGELDLLLFGQFGLGPLSADTFLQFNAAATANIQLALQLSNPFDVIQRTLAAMAQVQASLSAAASLSLPNLQIAGLAAANAALQASFGVKLGGIQAQIAAALAIKAPAVDFLAQLSANLALGPVVVGSWGFANPPTSLTITGSEISAAFSSGLPGIAPGEAVYGVLLVTKVPSASAGISATLLVL